MPSPNPRKRITVVASTQGTQKAEKALIRLGFESKANFAESQLIARNAVTKFFNCVPIQLDTFKRICSALALDWQEVLEEGAIGTTQAKRVNPSSIIADDSSTASSQEEPMQVISRQVTVVNQQKEVQAVIVLKGDLASVDANFKTTFELLLKTYGGSTIQIMDIQEGSIRITIKGSQSDIEQLRERVASGEFAQADGFPIEAIEIVSDKPLNGTENRTFRNKWEIVQEIRNSSAIRHQLVGMELSDADLRRGDLEGAILRSAILEGADLSSANLRSADLEGADLEGAILSRAILSSANLRSANLRAADLEGAILSGAILRSANLRAADLEGANLSNANLSSAILEDAILSRAILFGANLSSAILEDAILRSTGLSGAILRSANLRSADLEDANLSRAILEGADLEGAILSHANLEDAILEDTNLSRASVQNTRFGSGIGLSDAERQDLKRRGAIFNDSLGDRESNRSSSPIRF